MEALIQNALALLAQIAPKLAATGGTSAAIKLIASILPLIPSAISLGEAEIPIIKSIISDIRGSGTTTKDDLDQLDALDSQCDAIADAAIAKAQAEDAADVT